MTRPSDPGEPCRLLEWDSEFFRQRIATVTLPSLDAAAIDRVLGWCAEERIDCLYFLAEGGDALTSRLAQARGFRFVDVRMTLSRELDPRPSPRALSEGAVVRPAKPEDVPQLRELAAFSHTQSRFWSDGRFDRASCAELYATWIERSCSGDADAVWVADHESRASGYLTCHRRDGGLGEIGLVAVAPKAKGRGLGRALVERGLSWFRTEGCARVSVVTQGANVPGQRLYQSAGFATSGVGIWYHLWLDSQRHPRP